jgi:hypothetical protein
MWKTCFGEIAVVLHKQQFSDKTTKILGIEKIVGDDTC